MRNHGEHRISVIQDARRRRDGTYRAIGTLKGAYANAMAAFKVGNLDGLLPHFGKVEGELKHLEITEGGNMVANTRYSLREYFLSNQRGAAYIVDA